MSGTVREVAVELKHVYDLGTHVVPSQRPERLIRTPPRIYRSAKSKWRAITDRVESLHSAGVPVLLGTGSVEASEHLSHHLQKRDLDHHLLNARHIDREAGIIAVAGQCGQVTVATQMAGRGTDIKLGKGVAALGGLHVILTEPSTSARMDRQLFGRAGRQGDPGHAEYICSLQDSLLTNFWSDVLLSLLATAIGDARPLPCWLARVLIKLPQLRNEYRDRTSRRQLLRRDSLLTTALALSGQRE
jgi:preprotein translocase subunit SecA